MKKHFLTLLPILCAWSGASTAQAQSPGTVLAWGNYFYVPPSSVPVVAQSGVTAIAGEVFTTRS